MVSLVIYNCLVNILISNTIFPNRHGYLFILLNRMAALPPATLLTLDMLKPGVRYQIFNRAGELVGTGIFDRDGSRIGEHPSGIFRGIRTGIGERGYMKDERFLDYYYYRFIPAAFGGSKRFIKRTRNHKVLRTVKKTTQTKRHKRK